MDNSEGWALRAAHGNDPDWSLNELAQLVDDSGLPFPLTILVNGLFMKGRMVKVDEWADHLDVAMDKLLGGAAAAFAAQHEELGVEDLATVEATAGDVEQQRAAWPQSGWRSLVDKRRGVEARARERLAEAADDGPAPLDALPDELAQIAVELQLPKLAFTLADVSVFPVGPTGNTVRLPMVRVIVSQVAAWWPGQIDFGAQAD